jgi:hypothetical protein
MMDIWSEMKKWNSMPKPLVPLSMPMPIWTTQIRLTRQPKFYNKWKACINLDIKKASNPIQYNAYANSKTLDEGTKADAILRRMVQLYLEGDKLVKPSSITCSAAIKAWMSLAAAADSEDTSMHAQAASTHFRF